MTFEEALAQLVPKMQDKKTGLRYASNLWCSIANVTWHGPDDTEWYGATLRHSASVIAELRDRGENYLDFYCCDCGPGGSGDGETDTTWGSPYRPIVDDLEALGCELVESVGPIKEKTQ